MPAHVVRPFAKALFCCYLSYTSHSPGSRSVFRWGSQDSENGIICLKPHKLVRIRALCFQSLGSFVQTALTPCPRDSLARGHGPRSLWHSCSFRRALWDLLGFPIHGGQPRPSVKQTFFGPHRWDEVVASVLHHGPWLPLRLPCGKETFGGQFTLSAFPHCVILVIELCASPLSPPTPFSPCVSFQMKDPFLHL